MKRYVPTVDQARSTIRKALETRKLPDAPARLLALQRALAVLSDSVSEKFYRMTKPTRGK
jgi:hypothetical protein